MSYLNNLKKWNEFEGLDEKLKKQIKTMDETELKDAFTNDLQFGTAGLRGIIGPGTNRINRYIISKVTLGFGHYFIKKNMDITKGICIAYDNRYMSKELANEAAQVLMSLGIKVYLFEELRPTPQLSFTIRHLNCIGGIIITASHNPKEYNGYKIYNQQGAQFLPHEANLVAQEISKINDYFNISKKYDERLITLLGKNDDVIYLNDIKSVTINKDLPKNFNIVYTPLHGTGSIYVKELLKDVGYNVFCVSKQMINDPEFSNTKSSNPEDKEAFKMAIDLAKTKEAKVVFATDPDADRMGMAILHNEKYHILTGNEIGILLFNYIVTSRKKNNTLSNDLYMFLSLVSSSLPVQIAIKHNVNFDMVLTGFKWIADKIENITKNNSEFIFGFEEANGFLIKDCVRDKDGIQAILLMSEVVAYYNTLNKTLIDALDDIYKEYGYYLNDITNIKLSNINGISKINRIMAFFNNQKLNLKTFKVTAKDDLLISKRIDYVNNKEEDINLPKSDVLKFHLGNDWWFTLRPSGTEPKFKIYYQVKGKTKEESKKLLKLLKDEVMKIIDNL